MDVEIAGQSYHVTYPFSESRALIDYEGLKVLADKDPSTGTWDLSAAPATPDESRIIEEFIADTKDVTVVKITKDP